MPKYPAKNVIKKIFFYFKSFQKKETKTFTDWPQQKDHKKLKCPLKYRPDRI